MKKLYHLPSLLLLIIISACSSGKKSFVRGDYFDAVMTSITRLRQNPNHSKSQETLRTSYPMAVEWLETDANNQIASNAPNKYQQALLSYDKINQMHDAIRQSPGALRVIPNPKSYYAEIGPLKEKAAEELYQDGIALLMKGNREDSKRAFAHFSEANRYVPGYKDVIEYLDKSKFEATVFVVVEQVTVPGRYNLSGEFFQNKVEEFLNRNYSEQGFVQFYSADQAQRARLARTDQILRLQFDDFTVGNTTVRERVETVKKDSVKVGEAKVDGKTVPVYNTVTAQVTTIRKEVVSEGLLSMVIAEAATGRVLAHQRFPGRYEWFTTWGRFNGDERALSAQQLEMCRRREISPPDNQSLFLAFANPIYDQLIPSIRSFYRNY
jgi:tetratricopeptide (TPR) repeat protein